MTITRVTLEDPRDLPRIGHHPRRNHNHRFTSTSSPGRDECEVLLFDGAVA
jgi:hypothetical protein